MEYEDIKVGMRVKINIEEDDYDVNLYNGREGRVSSIEDETEEYSIGVDVEMLSGEIDYDVGFKPSELEAVG